VSAPTPTRLANVDTVSPADPTIVSDMFTP
jgi:hypothetical protein